MENCLTDNTVAPPQAGEGKKGAGQTRSYARNSHSICAHDMQNMTSHDTSHGGPAGPHDET